MTQQPRSYNLTKMYAGEPLLKRYIRLTVGEDASLAALLWHELVLGGCTGLPGLPGLWLRHVVYPKVFRHLHRKTYIGRHVTLRCPRQIATAEGVIIDEFVQLIATTRRAHGIKIGKGSFVRSYATINAGPPDGFIHIGSNSGVGQGTVIYGNGGVTIGDNVMIAGLCFVVASSHDFKDPIIPISEQGYTAKGIVIEDNVWIGAGTKVLDGVTIGEGAIVGANAVVNRSVQAGDRVGGVPAHSLIHRQALL